MRRLSLSAKRVCYAQSVGHARSEKCPEFLGDSQTAPKEVTQLCVGSHQDMMELEAHLLHVTQEMEAEMRKKEEWLCRQCPLCQPVDSPRGNLEASAQQLVFDEHDCVDGAEDLLIRSGHHHQVVMLAEGALKELDSAIRQDAHGANSTPRDHGGEVEQVVKRAEGALRALDNIITRNRATAGQQPSPQASSLGSAECSARCRATQAAIEAGLTRIGEMMETLEALFATTRHAAHCSGLMTWPGAQGNAARCLAGKAREGSQELKALLEESAACGVELVCRLERRGLHCEVDVLSQTLMQSTTALALHLRRQIAPHLQQGVSGDRCRGERSGGERGRAGKQQEWEEKALQASSR